MERIMSKRIRTKLLAAALLLTVGNGFLASSSQGAGTSSGGVATVTVRYADLDLNTSEGIAALYERLQRAARNVCRYYDGRGSLTNVRVLRACYERALAAAVGDVDLEGLNSVYGNAKG
jgi:UrcA family protein